MNAAAAHFQWNVLCNELIELLFQVWMFWSFDAGQVSVCLPGSSQMSPLRSLLQIPFEISALTLYISYTVHQAFTSQFANLHCYDHVTRDTTHNNIDDP